MSLFEFYPYLTIVYWAAWITLSLIAALWIYNDAAKLLKLFLNSSAIWWAFATLILGPVWVVLAYWLIHHSTISNRFNDIEKSNEH